MTKWNSLYNSCVYNEEPLTRKADIFFWPSRAFHNFCWIPPSQRSNPIKVSNAIMLILSKNGIKFSGINVTPFSSISYCRISEIAFVFKTKKVFDIKFSLSVWVMWPSINGDIVTKCIRHNTNSKSTCYVWGLTWTVNLDYLSTVSRSGWRVMTKPYPQKLRAEISIWCFSEPEIFFHYINGQVLISFSSYTLEP